jgi:hypothetical protein
MAIELIGASHFADLLSSKSMSKQLKEYYAVRIEVFLPSLSSL